MSRRVRSNLCVCTSITRVAQIYLVLSEADVANSYIKVGQKDQAIKLLDRAFQLRKFMEEDPYGETTIEVRTNATLSIGNSLLLKLPFLRDFISKNALLIVIATGYEAIGQSNPALKEIKVIKDEQNRDYALSTVVYSYAKAGLYKQARRVADVVKDGDRTQNFLEILKLGCI